MSQFKCEICQFEFKKKEGLIKHQNKKYKCNITTNFQCVKCKKYFRSNCSLKDHTEKDNCKEIILNNKIIEDINNKPIRSIDELYSIFSSVLNSYMSINIKIEIIREFNHISNHDLIKGIVDTNMPIIHKVKSLLLLIDKNKKI